MTFMFQPGSPFESKPRYTAGQTLQHKNTFACSVCGAPNDHTTGITGKGGPKTGMVSMCFTCGELSIFQVSPLGIISLREPTTEELASIHREHGEMLAWMTRFRAERVARGR